MNNNIVYEDDYRGYHITIEYDNDGIDDPRSWDNLGTMVCWHRNYNLGDEQPECSPQDWFIGELQSVIDYNTAEYDTLENLSMSTLIEKFKKYNIIIPIYAYQHSGITIRTTRTGQMADLFDSGQLGFIYVSKKKVREEYRRKYLSKKLVEKVEDHLRSEVQTYDDYLNGNLYGFQIYKLDNDKSYDKYYPIDSCWGFYPDHKPKRRDYAYCLDEAKSVVDCYADEDEKEQKLFTQRMLNQEVVE